LWRGSRGDDDEQAAEACSDPDGGHSLALSRQPPYQPVNSLFSSNISLLLEEQSRSGEAQRLYPYCATSS
jgi:hypothetical protein